MGGVLVWLMVAVATITIARTEKVVNGVKVLMTIKELVDPSHSALMVVDIQNGMVSNRGQCSQPD